MASVAAAAGVAGKRRTGVLALYKATLKQARLLPHEKVDSTLDSVRRGYKDSMGITDEEEITAAIKDGFGRLGYLRTVTPRIDNRARRAQSQHKTKYVIRGEQFVKGGVAGEGRGARRAQTGVINTNRVYDVDAERRLNWHKEREYMDSEHYKHKELEQGKYVPSWTRPIEDFLSDGLKFAKGQERDGVKDEHKLARNSVGSKGGVKMERLRVEHATWDVTHKGSAFDPLAPD